jgi:hypothetical protein
VIFEILDFADHLSDADEVRSGRSHGFDSATGNAHKVLSSSQHAHIISRICAEIRS